jgi:hypothetical protein
LDSTAEFLSVFSKLKEVEEQRKIAWWRRAKIKSLKMVF